MKIPKRVLWCAGWMGCLGIFYWLSRFVFFELHGMKSWPNTLAIAALLILLAASVAGRQILSAGAVAGYIGGFALAMAWGSHGVDPGGGATSNAWIIWGGGFMAGVAIGLIADAVDRRKQRGT